jgi:hypothetical protein
MEFAVQSIANNLAQFQVKKCMGILLRNVMASLEFGQIQKIVLTPFIHLLWVHRQHFWKEIIRWCIFVVRYLGSERT